MAEATPTSNERDARGNWRPAAAIQPLPIFAWPPKPARTVKWLFGFPGYLWPMNAFWLGVSVLTWLFLTPELAAMATLEAWWVGLILLRNLGFVLLLFGGLHLYLYILKGQGDRLKFRARPLAAGQKRFRFNNQTRENVFYALVYGVPIATAYEVATYWLFANGYLGFFGAEAGGAWFWVWFALLAFAAPFIHAFHFYFGHRLLHWAPLYRTVHHLHHRNIQVGPWSGLSMHPVEHAIYFSTVVVQWLLALHPVNALYQIHLALFNPALGHSGFEKVLVSKTFGVDSGSYFHQLHHQYFECNYGGSLAPLDQWFGTFHNGTAEADAAMRQRQRDRHRAA